MYTFITILDTINMPEHTEQQVTADLAIRKLSNSQSLLILFQGQANVLPLDQYEEMLVIEDDEHLPYAIPLSNVTTCVHNSVGWTVNGRQVTDEEYALIAMSKTQLCQQNNEIIYYM